MASTSKYIQLDPQLLIEYEYSNPVNPETISADSTGAKLLLLDNTYTGTTSVFTEDNPNIKTGNYRNISAIPIDNDKTKYAYLNTSNVVNYLDTDENLDSVDELLNQLVNPPNNTVNTGNDPAYDTIKIHMVSGFSFEELGDGFIFEVLIRDRGGKKHNLSSIVYLSSDDYEIQNPSPFINNERLFTNYIELKILSLDWITNDWLTDKTNDDSLGNLISHNSGYTVQNTIELSVKYIDKTEKINGQTYFKPGIENITSINKTDEYSGLSAVIEDSLNGDYFEVYGSYNGNIYEDFMVNLNEKPNTDLVVVHDIMVFEQVNNSFIKTSEQSFIQSKIFEDSYKFRPIILNSHIALSYRIEYTLRILNKVDNSQIIRKTRYSSFNVKKYGRRFRKLNLGSVPIVTKVYNSLPGNNSGITLNNDVQFKIDGKNVIKQTEFVQGFKESIKISASITNVKTTPANKQEGDIIPTAKGDTIKVGNAPLKIINTTPSNVIYKQSEGKMSISPFDNFTKFIFYDNSNQESSGSENPELMDLVNTGIFYLSFIDEDSGDEVRIKNYTNIKDINPSQGEVIFKIDKNDSKKILKFKSNNFYISARLEIGDEKSDETMMYSGTWFKPQEKYNKLASSIIKELKESNDYLKISVDSEKEESEKVITDLENDIDFLEKEKKILKDQLSELTDNVISLNSNIKKKIKLKDNKVKDSILKKSKPINTKLIKARIKKGEGKFISPKSFEKLKGVSLKKFKINK